MMNGLVGFCGLLVPGLAGDTGERVGAGAARLVEDDVGLDGELARHPLDRGGTKDDLHALGTVRHGTEHAAQAA